MAKNFYNVNETNNTFRLGLQGFTSGNLTIANIDDTFKIPAGDYLNKQQLSCLLYTSPSPRDGLLSRMPSSA